MTAVWQQLALYESRDLLSRLFSQRHSRQLSAEQAREIINHLVQGREYFTSARQAPDLIRPLLLYYGVLAFTRGLILFITRWREASLSRSHGCEVVNWNQHLASGPGILLDLPIRFTRGTFSELAQATGNAEPLPNGVGMNGESAWGWNPRRQDGTASLTSGTTMTLTDILSRLVFLDEYYRQVTGDEPKCLRLRPNIMIDRAERSVEIRLPIRFEGGSQVLAIDKSRVIDEYQIRRELLTERNPFESVIRLPEGDNGLDAVPPIRRGRERSIYLVPPLQDGTRLSTLSLLYLASYATGMLVRYYPSVWAALINRERGDYAFPLLKAVIHLVEELFPEILLSELDFV